LLLPCQISFPKVGRVILIETYFPHLPPSAPIRNKLLTFITLIRSTPVRVSFKCTTNFTVTHNSHLTMVITWQLISSSNEGHQQFIVQQQNINTYRNNTMRWICVLCVCRGTGSIACVLVQVAYRVSWYR
jgi:hypothetical protein